MVSLSQFSRALDDVKHLRGRGDRCGALPAFRTQDRSISVVSYVASIDPEVIAFGAFPHLIHASRRREVPGQAHDGDLTPLARPGSITQLPDTVVNCHSDLVLALDHGARALG